MSLSGFTLLTEIKIQAHTALVSYALDRMSIAAVTNDIVMNLLTLILVFLAKILSEHLLELFVRHHLHFLLNHFFYVLLWLFLLLLLNFWLLLRRHHRHDVWYLYLFARIFFS